MGIDACEKLFTECYQNDWVISGEKAAFLKKCRQDQPRPPSIQPPANAFTLSTPTVLARDISAGGGATYERCRGYAGGTLHREAVTIPERPWYVTPLAWAVAAVSAVLFIAGLRTMPSAPQPAVFPLGTSTPWPLGGDKSI